MIKQIIEQVKVKAIEDDNAYWLKQEEWIQIKDCKDSIGKKMLYFSLGLLTMSIIYFFL